MYLFAYQRHIITISVNDSEACLWQYLPLEVFFIKAVVKSRLCVICVRRILVDAGESGNVEYINNLAKVLKQHRTSIQEIVITHWHLDHVGGVPDVCSQIDGCKCYCLCTFFMAALCNRGATIFLPCDFYLSFFLLSFFFFPRLISAAGDWISTILPHMAWP